MDTFHRTFIFCARVVLAAGLGLAAPAGARQAPALDVGTARAVDLAALIEQDAGARTTYTPPVSSSFKVPSLDPDSALKISGYFQFRYVANRRDTSVPDEDWTQGFGFREVRLNLSGNLYGKDLTYYVQSAFDTGTVRVTDLWLRYALDERWAIKFGSFKPMFLWEENSSARYQLLSERSIVDAYFAAGRAQQVEMSYAGERVQASIAFDDGWRNNTDSRLGDLWGVTARAQWLAFGSWSQHEDMQAWRGQEAMLVLGVGGHTQDGSPSVISASESRNRFLNDSQLTAWTADAHFEAGGFSVYAAIMGEHVRQAGSLGGGSRDAMGAMIQAGYFLTDNVQVVGRAEWGNTDGDVNSPKAFESANDEFAAVTLGVAYYFWGNSAKLVADVVIPLDEVGDVWGMSSRATLTDDLGADGQAALRVLWQWVF